MENYSGQKDLLLHETPVFSQEDYAGFWLRVAAYFIDALAAWAFFFVASMLLGTGFFFTPDMEEVTTGFWGVMGIMNLAVILYFPLMESSKLQATLGKRAVGIIVTDLDGRRIGFGKALGRFLGKILSAVILNIGFIMAGFTEKKQGLHDIIAGTLVIRAGIK